MGHRSQIGACGKYQSDTSVHTRIYQLESIQNNQRGMILVIPRTKILTLEVSAAM